MAGEAPVPLVTWKTMGVRAPTQLKGWFSDATYSGTNYRPRGERAIPLTRIS